MSGDNKGLLHELPHNSDGLNRRRYNLMLSVILARAYQLVFLYINHFLADISTQF